MLGLRFCRQRVLHGFVVDFYCPALRMILELDGAPHDTGAQVGYDAARTSWLAASGYRVIRIRNKDLTREYLESILKAAVRDRQTSPRPPSPRSGEGDRG